MATPKRMEDPRPGSLNDGRDGLRRVELDVLVPKIMKTAALEKCESYVQSFSKCCKGRTISLVFACRDENQALDDCLRRNMTDGDFADAKRVFIEAKRVNMAKIKAEGDAGFKATEHMGATGM